MDIAGIIIAIVSALVGGGGAAAFIRARGQNKVDLVTTLTNRIHTLETRLYEQDFRNTNLVIENAKHTSVVANLETDIKQYITDIATKAKEIEQLKLEKNSYMMLVEEAAKLRQQMQIMQSQNDYLNTEAGKLQSDIDQLKSKVRNG